MPCYHPLVGYRSRDINPSGKRSIVFNPSQALEADNPLKIACGKCIGCRLENSRQWAMRMTHEASLHEFNCFITLTYSDENLPLDRCIDIEAVKKFMKRLRKRLPKLKKDGLVNSEEGPILYKQCGEYGDKFGRPHYHLILFNIEFNDLVAEECRRGIQYYSSATLGSLWKFGMNRIGAVTFESTAYVARYITKKINGEFEDEHYVDPSTGLIRRKEFSSQSNGIGKGWLKKYFRDVYAHDYVVLRGKKLKPPKYYDSQFEMWSPSELEAIRDDRHVRAKQNGRNCTRERLEVREEMQKIKQDLLKRGFEYET